MEKLSRIEATRTAIAKGVRWLERAFATVEAFFKKVSQILLKATGIIICLGALCALIGWLLASARPDPLGPTWNMAVWLVIIGVFILIIGILALSARYVLRIGMIGQFGIMLFLLGALALMAGAFAVNLFILPWMAKLFAQFPNLGSVLQSGYNTVQGGINSAASSGSSAASTVCSTITNPFGGSTSCQTSSAPVVPSQHIPSLSVDDLLGKIGLPSIATLGTLGLVFLSGAPLAPGALLMGIVFLLAGVRPRSSLLLLMAAALLNLGGQFVLHLTFLGPLLGALLFLAFAWFGFTLWMPWKFSLLEKLFPLEAATTAGETAVATTVGETTASAEA